jgi:hypothetical protein
MNPIRIYWILFTNDGWHNCESITLNNSNEAPASTLYTEIYKGNVDKREFNRDMTNKKRKIQPEVK